MFSLPELDYAYDALEPHIDARTMEIHHSRHHQGYTNKLNAAIEGTDAEGKSIEEILNNASTYPAAVVNNGGGFYNHNLFWKNLSPNGGGQPSGALAEAIARDFGSFDNFQEQFNAAAASQFGSGWAWLIQKEDGSLEVCSTPNQDSPIMDFAPSNGKVLLALDVWEHAYYLHYQNKRPDYIQAFWNVVNWPEVELRFQG
jgi:Fe-Mn family superoxide dismutase